MCALGDWNNGWALYLLDGRPVVTFNLFGDAHRTRGHATLAAGRHTIGFEYARRAPARRAPSTLHVDGDVRRRGAAPGRPPVPLADRRRRAPARRPDRGFPVCDDYQPPFPFTGTVDHVEIEIPNLAPRSEDAARSAADVAQALRHE